MNKKGPLVHAAMKVSQDHDNVGIFAIRGDLDGTTDSDDYSKIRQFIGLMIHQEEFLLPIDLVDEIIILNHLTYVPSAPPFVEGVINLRGTILPAVNLRSMMGLPSLPPTAATRIIITHWEGIQLGIIVDGITYVVSLSTNQAEFQNLGGRGSSAALIGGISKRGDKVNGILDLSKVVLAITGAKQESAA